MDVINLLSGQVHRTLSPSDFWQSVLQGIVYISCRSVCNDNVRVTFVYKTVAANQPQFFNMKI